MEEDKKQITVAPWLRQILIGIIGTSIGLGLSFAVNRAVENNKQQKAQRETAIMAVYDIDEIRRQIKEDKEHEDRMFEAARYASTHLEELDSISPDTLYMAINYLFDNPSAVKAWASDTRENTFNSSMETRRNLGDIQFYDNVQECYQVRRELKQVMETESSFKRPFSSEDYEYFLQQLGYNECDASGTMPLRQATAKFLRLVLQKKSISLYLQRYLKRRRIYNTAIGDLERLNRENKYLMDITEKDMEEYVRRNVDRTQPATVALIVGRWELEKDERLNVYLFNADSTVVFTDKGITEITLMMTDENMEVPVNISYTLQLKGKWTLTVDSMAIEFDNETAEYLAFDVDFSALPRAALERRKDSLEIKKKQIKDYYLNATKAIIPIISNTVKFDVSGNTMMWTDLENKDYTDQLFRKEE